MHFFTDRFLLFRPSRFSVEFIRFVYIVHKCVHKCKYGTILLYILLLPYNLRCRTICSFINSLYVYRKKHISLFTNRMQKWPLDDQLHVVAFTTRLILCIDWSSGTMTMRPSLSNDSPFIHRNQFQNNGFISRHLCHNVDPFELDTLRIFI